MSADQEDVLAANAAFYDAFSERDLEAMDEIWARDAPVACIHPGWRALSGRESVMASWRSILDGPSAPQIACTRESAYLFGDTAFVVCVETVEGGDLMATNVFVRELGRWKMVHHHAGPIAHPSEEEEEDPPTGLLN